MHIIQINNRLSTPSGDAIFFKRNIALLKEKGHEINVLHADESLNLNKDGSSFKRHFISFFTYAFNFRMAYKLSRMFLSNRPDLVHLHIYHGYFTSSIILIARLFKIPVFQTMHDMRLVCPISFALRDGKHCFDCQYTSLRLIQNNCRKNIIYSIYNWFEWKLDQVIRGNFVKTISVSAWQKQVLISAGARVNFKIDNFVPTVKSLDLEKKINQICYVTRIEDEKGILEFIELVKSLPKIHFILAGTGSKVDRVKSSLAGVTNFQYKGICNSEEVNKLLTESIMSLNLSKAYETFGLTVVESLRCGTPCLVNPKGNLKSLAEKHKDVILTGSNLKERKSAITRFISLEDSKRNIIFESCKKTAQKYSEDAYYKKLKEAYDSAVR